jgi:hypothetical protein
MKKRKPPEIFGLKPKNKKISGLGARWGEDITSQTLGGDMAATTSVLERRGGPVAVAG